MVAASLSRALLMEALCLEPRAAGSPLIAPARFYREAAAQ